MGKKNPAVPWQHSGVCTVCVTMVTCVLFGQNTSPRAPTTLFPSLLSRSSSSSSSSNVHTANWDAQIFPEEPQRRWITCDKRVHTRAVIQNSSVTTSRWTQKAHHLNLPSALLSSSSSRLLCMWSTFPEQDAPQGWWSVVSPVGNNLHHHLTYGEQMGRGSAGR